MTCREEENREFLSRMHDFGEYGILAVLKDISKSLARICDALEDMTYEEEVEE